MTKDSSTPKISWLADNSKIHKLKGIFFFLTLSKTWSPRGKKMNEFWLKLNEFWILVGLWTSMSEFVCKADGCSELKSGRAVRAIRDPYRYDPSLWDEGTTSPMLVIPRQLTPPPVWEFSKLSCSSLTCQLQELWFCQAGDLQSFLRGLGICRIPQGRMSQTLLKT